MEKFKMIQPQKELLRLNIQYFADGDESKTLADQIKSGFEAMKVAAEKQDKEIKKFGAVTQETKSELEKINTAIDEAKARLDAIETKDNRGYTPGQDGKKGTPDEQAMEKKTAFFTFLREGKAGLTKEQKSLVEDATGEIIVPEDLDTTIYRELPKLVVMRQLAATRNTTSNRVRRRSMNEVTMGWGKLETTAAKLSDFESTLTPDEEYLYVENLYGLTKIGEDELEDTDLNLQAYMAESFGRARAEKEAYAFLRGTGHSNLQPEGILTNTDVQRTETAATSAITLDDIIRLMYATPAQYRNTGVFLMPSELEMTVRTLKNGNGDYVWQPSAQAGTPNVLFGRPVYTQDDFDAMGAGVDIAVFGDFKAGYQILDRQGLTLTRINELYAEEGLVGFKAKARVGGGVVRPKAFRVLKVKQ
ncbi:phage major capsid protein [Bacillus sp. FJAT-52991]|uniref:Phage major capsid protein n=1 Tax=Bacillus kandeliae TaxID=3129297 RepID=A0ABZ2N2D1_9BACI